MAVNAKISVIDLTGRIGQNDMIVAINALQKQLNEVGSVWDFSAQLFYYATRQQSPSENWLVWIGEDIDVEGLAGYHGIDNTKSTKVITSGTGGYVIGTNSGKPFGVVKHSDNWTVTLSHELIEMCVNPNIDRFYNNVDANGDGVPEERLLAEICDPVQDDVYLIDGVRVCNYVFPDWYTDSVAIAGKRYDKMGVIDSPRTLSEGGYASFWWAAGWWQSWKTLYVTTVKKLGSNDYTLTATEKTRLLKIAIYSVLSVFLFWGIFKLSKRNK